MPNFSMDDNAESPQGRQEPLGLACNRCRQSKLKCSRDRPACQHCRKTSGDCVYETKRIKPGLKAGAVDSLHKRLDALEQHMRQREQQDVAPQTASFPTASTNNTNAGVAYEVVSLLAKELPKLIQTAAANSDCASEQPAKKRRLAYGASTTPCQAHQLPRSGIILDDSLQDSIVDAYFSQVHHWIPMVHQGRFRQRLVVPEQRDKLEVLIQAMAMSAAKYVPNGTHISASCSLSARREWIVSAAMNQLSVESMQALIIVAFNDIGSGNAQKAWSIIGSLTRTIEYMQLTMEQDGSETQSLCRPHQSIGTAKSWTELEERRRVFWNVLSLDRFCSVSMGWSTSLTSNDVCRRLPCDGVHWRKGNQVITPFFGIWDKSAGRIGNPISFMTGSHQVADKVINEAETRSDAESMSPLAGVSSSQAMDTSTIGAYAYCIEASESMSRVTSYFLQQKVNMRDHEEINLWLTRFKELDLRLVHWKMLLPSKWKSNVTHLQSPRMDPNLTLAHITHNASMIMLHQPIGYPSPLWGFRHRLPSACSADTCYSAGVEIATITQNYLRIAKASPLASQYAFCIYIAARMFLVHWRYYAGNPLGEEFWVLVHSLAELSHRWGNNSETSPDTNLAGKYALKLRELHRLCAQDESFRLDPMDYTCEIEHGTYTTSSSAASAGNDGSTSASELFNHIGDAQFMTSAPVTKPSESSGFSDNLGSSVSNMASAASLPTPLTSNFPDVGMQALRGGVDNLDASGVNTMQNILLDSRFMNLDRVITYDDGSLFAAELNDGSW